MAEISIAETLLALHRSGDAMAHLVEAERIVQRGSGRERAVQAWLLTVRAEILLGQRHFEAAIPVAERADELLEDAAADPTNHALAMWALARALNQLGGDPARVRSLAERALAIFAGIGPQGVHDRDEISRFLSRLANQDLTDRSTHVAPRQR